MRGALAFLAVCGCGVLPVDSEVTRIQAVCVDGEELRVDFQGCLSSSCDTLLDATCTATFDGGVIDVTGVASIRSQGTVCTTDCGFITARCPLPDGANHDTTILTFGGDAGGPILADAGCNDNG